MSGIKKRQKVKNVFESFIVQTIRNIHLNKEKIQSKNNQKAKSNMILQKFSFSEKSLLYEKYGCHAYGPHRPVNRNHKL